jgi:hypothetical protein
MGIALMIDLFDTTTRRLDPRAKSLIGLHKGQIQIQGDIVALLAAKLWESLR